MDIVLSEEWQFLEHIQLLSAGPIGKVNLTALETAAAASKKQQLRLY